MSEQEQRQRVVKALKTLDAHSIECPIKSGVPDVNCSLGWLELKYLREWPKRRDTKVTIRHYTEEQRTWARRRRLCGGKIWLLLQAHEDWMLFDGMVAANHLGNHTREGLIPYALQYWQGNFTDESLLYHIRLHGKA